MFTITVCFTNLEDKPDTEKLRAIFLDDTRYQIDDIPLFAYNLAKGDIVAVGYDDVAYFDGFIKQSENTTIQIVLLDNSDDTRHMVRQTLLAFDIEFKYHSQIYFAIHIPKDTDYQPIYEIIQELENQDILSFREACLSDWHKAKIHRLPHKKDV